jgi:hypothetical protein
MYASGVFTVIYMHICLYSILKEKQKKSEKLGALCRVYAHGKGLFGHFAVRIHTAKSPRGGHLCIAQPAGCSASGFAVRVPAGRTAMSDTTAHGKAVCMAMPPPTAKRGAWQRT